METTCKGARRKNGDANPVDHRQVLRARQTNYQTESVFSLTHSEALER